jgi:DNA-binding CsgD family transcriptional regulator
VATGAKTTPRISRFIGRAGEQSLLHAGLDAALAGVGQVMLIAGEPGVGKTRLAAQMTERARSLGMASAWGRCTGAEGSPPYWPFVQVFRQLGGGSVLQEPGSGDERFALFELVVDGLRASAEPDGLLVVLDDVQWADPASVAVLTHLASAIGDARLAFVVTYRDTETVGQEPLRAALGALGRESSVTRVALKGLSVPEVGECLADAAGFAVPESVAAAVCSRTNGNPFFVGELGAILAESSDGVLPAGVRDAVRSRLARLSPQCRAVVSAAAVLGSELDPAVLAHVTGSPLTAVLDALDEAATAGIVTTSGARAFAHELIREAARLDVATAGRLGLHQRMAEYLLSRSDAGARCAEVAFHLLESLPAGDGLVAAAWAERAADQAMERLAWEQAATLYGDAVEAVSASESGAPARSRLLLAKARAQVRLSDLDGARDSLTQAADIARECRDAEGLAHAAFIMDGITDVQWEPIARRLCEDALALSPPGDSALRARLLAQLILAETWKGGSDMDARSAEALAMAERVGDRQAVTETLRARQTVRSGPDGAPERLTLGDRLLVLAGTDDHNAALWGHLWRFDANAQLGRIDAAEAELMGIDAAAGRLAWPLARWHALRCRAAIALARGRFAEASDLGARAVALADSAGRASAALPSVGFLVMLAAHTGDASQVPDFDLAVPMIAAGPMRAAVAWLRLALGDRQEAQRLYNSLRSPVEGPPFLRLSLSGFTAELAAEFDDRDAAADVYELLLPHAGMFVCGGAGVVAIDGSVRRPLGQAAAAMGRLDEAVSHLRAAVDVNRDAGMPPAAAYSLYYLAQVLARRKRIGDGDEASGLVAIAAAEAERMGMAPLAKAARSLEASLAGVSQNPLTRREQEVARLVTQGLTNRQIAGALHISERTAESHVQHILTKYGLATRAQIAAKVAGGQIRIATP